MISLEHLFTNFHNVGLVEHAGGFVRSRRYLSVYLPPVEDTDRLTNYAVNVYESTLPAGIYTIYARGLVVELYRYVHSETGRPLEEC